MQLEINPEFKALIPPLSPDELAQLEKNIMRDGCRDPLVVWRGTLIDGHNRYEICTANGVAFETAEADLEDAEAVKVWIIDNQHGRRNLSDGWKFELAQTRKAILAAKGKATQGQRTDLLSTIDKKSRAHNTQKEIATDLGWSTGKTAMADKVWRDAEPEVIEKIKANETTINHAYREIAQKNKKEKRALEIAAVKQKIESEPESVDGLFGVVAIDPPWPYGRAYDPETSRVANPYPEMPLEEIGRISLPLEPDAVVFLWTTHAFLPASFGLLESWGLRYRATLVWDKEKMGMGATVRMQCEFCLLATKGNPILQGESARDIIREARRQHSRKPEAFYGLVERVTVGRRLDYFSREGRKGWVSYGAEAKKF